MKDVTSAWRRLWQNYLCLHQSIYTSIVQSYILNLNLDPFKALSSFCDWSEVLNDGSINKALLASGLMNLLNRLGKCWL